MSKKLLRGSQGEPGRRLAKMVRVPVFHRWVFRTLVQAALEGEQCLRYGGEYWEPVVEARRFAIYQRTSNSLACIQERVEDYEFFFYGRLLRSHCGADGALRPRTRLRRQGNGGYRSFGDGAGAEL